MDKNLLWAVVLSIGVYALWFGVVDKRVPKPAAPTASAAAQSAAPASSLRKETARPDASTAEDREQLQSESSPLAAPAAQLLINPRGAAVVSCRYRAPLGMVELVHEPRPGLFATWPELLFAREPSGEGVRFAASRPDGLRISKEFLPEKPDAPPRMRIRLFNPTRQALESGEWTMTVGPGLDTVPTDMAENQKTWRALGFLAGEQGSQGKIEVLKPGTHAGPYRWVGVDNRYFLAAVLMPPGDDFKPVESDLPPQITLRARNATIAPGGERLWEIPYYLGAKGQTWLTRYQCGLERSIDFGFFAQLGRLILKVLNGIQRVTGNWGWSIVLMTFLIQALLFPLTFKSMKAMTAMKKLQPELARLQQKYAKDPSRLNAETMELYKKSGTNPLGGCLPLMIQMPVFIALFNALRNAWEIHGAPWIFWVRDLSARDPFYVLPVLMGGVMFLQNRMNPAATADPTQKTMMTWMPIIFTFMFLKSPSGLVLYWLTSSILSAAIQMALRSRLEKACRFVSRRYP